MIRLATADQDWDQDILSVNGRIVADYRPDSKLLETTWRWGSSRRDDPVLNWK
jgi:hypothetical protein